MIIFVRAGRRSTSVSSGTSPVRMAAFDRLGLAFVGGAAALGVGALIITNL